MTSTPECSHGPSTEHAEEALNTAELLEGILKNLTRVELKQARLVSDFWKDVIDSSPALQQILFNNDEIWKILKEAKTAPGRFLAKVSFQRADDTTSDPFPSTVKLHPFLRPVNTWDPRSRFHGIEVFTFRFWERKLAIFPRKGLWRQQLVCQPPLDFIPTINTFYHYPKVWPYEFWDRNVVNVNGVTLGDLQDMVFEAMGEQKKWVTTKKGRRLQPRLNTDGEWKGINALRPGESDEVELAEGAGYEIEEDGLTKRQYVQLLVKMDFTGHAELPGVLPPEVKEAEEVVDA
ncbi:hypothetical protein CERZMDRAFT_99341 [Cercospora zeae-maydis SCOH1-5]|uniref:F-box domain-containing protein n=1 Tax=Cercospora zeae-maydis SCOH1-5 TaxID=717836 RepID=A0A6A6FBE4_9PEZI|nr:hypothetical protein CERZMDRAFT_99341 [Cercospora zeae-maydis SCOH1-5]